MADYDNTNRGALFATNGRSEIIREGDLNIQGKDGRIVLVKTQADKGPMFFLYRKIGAMFPATEKTSENSPDTSGPLDFGNLRIAGWRKVSAKGVPYTSLVVSGRRMPGRREGDRSTGAAAQSQSVREQDGRNGGGPGEASNSPPRDGQGAAPRQGRWREDASNGSVIDDWHEESGSHDGTCR